MERQSYLDLEEIKNKLIAKKAIPRFKENSSPLDISSILKSPEDTQAMNAFLTSLDDSEFDPKKIKMPKALAKAVIKMITKNLLGDGISYSNLLNSLSYQLNMTYGEIYELIAMDPEDVTKVEKLFVAEPNDENITKGMAVLIKLAKTLGIKKHDLVCLIYRSFCEIFDIKKSTINFDPDDPNALSHEQYNAAEEHEVTKMAAEICDKAWAGIDPWGVLSDIILG